MGSVLTPDNLTRRRRTRHHTAKSFGRLPAKVVAKPLRAEVGLHLRDGAVAALLRDRALDDDAAVAPEGGQDVLERRVRQHPLHARREGRGDAGDQRPDALQLLVVHEPALAARIPGAVDGALCGADNALWVSRRRVRSCSACPGQVGFAGERHAVCAAACDSRTGPPACDRRGSRASSARGSARPPPPKRRRRP